jgi:hypothetical protein
MTLLVTNRINAQTDSGGTPDGVAEANRRFKRGVDNLQKVYPDIFEIVRNAAGE